MRLFNNINFSLSRLRGNAAHEASAKPDDSHVTAAAGTLPPGKDSSLGARTVHYARIKGNAMSHKLRTMFQPSKADKLPPSIPLDMSIAMREALQNNHASFQRTHSDIKKALAAWPTNENQPLQPLLKPFIVPGRKEPGVPQTDGLRSGITGFLNGMVTKNCGASTELVAAARNLSEAPIAIIKLPNGSEIKFTLVDLGSIGELGIGKIDGLTLSQEQKTRIAQRVELALTELSNLGTAYVNGGAVPAPLMDRANCIVLTPPGADPVPRNTVGKQRTRPKGPRPMPQPARQAPAPAAGTMTQERLAALAGTYLSIEELQLIFQDPSRLAEMEGVLIERDRQYMQGRQAEAAPSRPLP